jgi:hypothetical protein
MNILDFLMKNDAVIQAIATDRKMMADEAFKMIVYNQNHGG